MGGSILFFLSIVARFTYKYLALVLESKRTWTVLSVATIVLFSSGHMWNHIRGPPYAGQSNGKPEIFAPGFSSQYVGETQAIGMLCK